MKCNCYVIHSMAVTIMMIAMLIITMFFWKGWVGGMIGPAMTVVAFQADVYHVKSRCTMVCSLGNCMYPW